MPHIQTPAEFHALLKPFENYRQSHTHSGPNTYVDIEHGSTHSRGASIRGVSDAGVEVFFYNSIELIPFDAIDRVTVRTADLCSTLSSVTYERAALRRAA